MLIDEKCEGTGILDVCVAIDKLTGADVNYDEEKRIVTLNGKDLFNGTKSECKVVIAAMFVMALYMNGSFDKEFK